MVEKLSRFRLFADLDPDDLDLLEALFELKNFAAGAAIFQVGDPADRFYLVASGKVVVEYTPYDAPPIVLARARAGDVVGWSAVLGKSKYTSAAICATTVQVLGARGAALRALCIKHPRTGQIVLDRLAETVSGRWTDAHEQVRTILGNGFK